MYQTTGPALTSTAMTELTGGIVSTPRYNVDNLNSELPTTAPASTPNSATDGKIILAVPAITNSPLADTFYQGWLYAAVVDSSGNFRGLYVTKDDGDNWTLLNLPQVDLGIDFPTNDESQPTDVSTTGPNQWGTSTGQKL